MVEEKFVFPGLTGLNDEQVKQSRLEHGSNQLHFKKDNVFLEAISDLVKEPMVLLLLIAASIYFISGEYGDGLFLTAAIILVATISLYQDSRSKAALEKLKAFTQPASKVIRNGQIKSISSEELVIGDFLVVAEGNLIAADGIILQSNDFSVNEAILTGESFPVFKTTDQGNNLIFQGTNVLSGQAVVQVKAIGVSTELGKIGATLKNIAQEKTPLETQINNFVRKMVIVGAVIFVIVWAINFFKTQEFLDSLLKALTLAMSILPEEIPVAFTTFMALGAWRLMQMGVVVKQMKTVETLGSATVICTDKTGTLTENKMSLAKLYLVASDRITDVPRSLDEEQQELIRLAMWASEPVPFDPMEVVLHSTYEQTTEQDERPLYKLVYEYPLEGKPPMMTHLFENESGQRIIVSKGAPEGLIAQARLDPKVEQNALNALDELAAMGYRVLGVGEVTFEGVDFPQTQQEFPMVFKGLLAFQDPPKANIQDVLKAFEQAGIDLKIVTGDNPVTTRAIARQIGLKGQHTCINGAELVQLSDEALFAEVQQYQLFTRMFPEAKLRIINTLKAQNEIVAMTGDGVNDGPALKAAHIGIAMGKKGSEIAKDAASLILLEDDLSKMVDAIAMGRKIYSNLKKAIQYIISIHIPIVLTVFLPLALGWKYPNIFSPVHIIFMELIMGPTCSIIYENEPMEKNTMQQGPRPFSSTFFNWKELTTSIFQGLMITAGTLLAYQMGIKMGLGEASTRTLVFATLISANIVLTLVNRSFYYSLFTTILYRNHLVPVIIGTTILISGLLIFVPPLAHFFQFQPLSKIQLLLSLAIGLLSVIWFEGVKWYKRLQTGKGVVSHQNP